MAAEPAVDIADVLDARRLLDGVAEVTPMQEAGWLSRQVGGRVLLKCENLQRTGSFKIRGAYTRLARMDPEVRAAGVVAASAGNHAQGVALAARMMGVKAVIFMPEGAPIPKEQATRGYGAEVRFAGATVTEALEEAEAYAEASGATLIHPYDHADIVSGQGTCGLEILEQCPDVRTVVVPTGGGGLLAGIATAVQARAPQARVIGVQAKGAAAYPLSLEEGRPVPLAQMSTMADGIAIASPGRIPFATISRRVDSIVTVSEESLSAALLMLLERGKVMVEPAGAVGVAALLDGELDVEFPAVVVLSGGNIDPLLLTRVLRHGLASAGRYVYLRARIADVPGGLVGFLEEVARLAVNVIDLDHERVSSSLGIDEVEVRLQAETRGLDHAERVLGALRSRGYTVAYDGPPSQ
ncbi:threonine ammonia-lyase [Nocardioidaceae bacterium]|nr:threonine ammonia-lyase [Nocardioidaceae bacterium]